MQFGEICRLATFPDNDKVKTGTVSDLMGVKGETAGMGAKNSGTIGSNTVLL